MKILVINTFETRGGAAIAAKRLFVALNKTGEVEAKMLVNERQTSDPGVFEVADTWLKKLIRKYRFIFEKVLFMPLEVSKKERFSFSTARFGSNISNHPLVREADILHIHWVNNSFLSHRNLRQLLQLNKPVVITMHDMWYFTGGCHHARNCRHYELECGNCPFLKRPDNNDLSHKIHQVKRSIYSPKMAFVACSKWLKQSADSSSLLKDRTVYAIPNPLDTNVFKPGDKAAARAVFGLPQDKILLLYAAARVDDERKGYKYLSEALQTLYHSDLPFKKDIEIVLMGDVKDPQVIDFPFPTHFVGNLSDTSQIVACYNAASMLITPSLEENLPNTIIESMACGTPTVAFRTGGIPEIIDHQVNGYIAEYRNAADLITGISWIVEQDHDQLAQNCKTKVETAFSEKAVVLQFTSLYRSLLTQ